MKLPSYLLLVITTVEAQQIPTRLTFPSTLQPVNGSSATGHCTVVTRVSDRFLCDDPTSSVVYDGHIPTLTGLDGNMWASQLLTINASSAVLVFDFTGTPNFQVRRVEMVVFNCPQWGISVQSVVLTNSDLAQLGSVNPTLSSCDSLVRVCIPNLRITSSQAVLRLEFTTLEPTNWIHFAEVGFYASTDTCPAEILIPEPTTATTATSASTTTMERTTHSSSIPLSSATIPLQATDEPRVIISPCPSCSTSSIVLACVITAITTAIIAMLIFAALQIILWNYHPRFTAQRVEQATCQQADEGEGGVVVSGHSYSEIEDVGEESTMEMRDNEAYSASLGQRDLVSIDLSL